MAWTCENCEKQNEPVALECIECKSARPVEAAWNCPNCETSNADYNKHCEVCGMEQIEELLYNPAIPAIVEDQQLQIKEEMLRTTTNLLWEVPGKIRIRDKNWLPAETARPLPMAGGKKLPRFIEEWYVNFKSFSKRKKRKVINRTLVALGLFIGFSVGFSTAMWFIAGIGAFSVLRSANAEVKDMYERFLEPSSGDPLMMLPGAASGGSERFEDAHKHPVVALSYSREGDQLISLDNRGSLFRWDVVSGEKKRSANVFGGFPEKVALGTRGAYAMIGGELKVYDSAARLKHTLRVPMPVSGESDLKLSNSGKFLALGSTVGRIGVWNVVHNSHFELKETMPGNINSLNFFPSDDHLVSGNGLGGLQLWNVKSRRPIFEDLRRGTEVVSTAVSSSGTHFAAGYSDGVVRIFEYPGLRETNRLALAQGTDDKVYSLFPRQIAFVPGSDRFVTVDQLGQIHLWQVWEDGEPEIVTELSGSSPDITHIAISKQGSWMATGSKDGRVAMFHIGGYL